MFRGLANTEYSHILFTRDFNSPRINWEDWTTPGGEHTSEFRFVEAIRDAYSYEHVIKATRGRGTSIPSLLDLVITNEEDMVDSVEITAPLRRSDHSMMEFTFNCYTKRYHNIRKT